MKFYQMSNKRLICPAMCHRALTGEKTASLNISPHSLIRQGSQMWLQYWGSYRAWLPLTSLIGLVVSCDPLMTTAGPTKSSLRWSGDVQYLRPAANIALLASWALLNHSRKNLSHNFQPAKQRGTAWKALNSSAALHIIEHDTVRCFMVLCDALRHSMVLKRHCVEL